MYSLCKILMLSEVDLWGGVKGVWTPDTDIKIKIIHLIYKLFLGPPPEKF